MNDFDPSRASFGAKRLRSFSTARSRRSRATSRSRPRNAPSPSPGCDTCDDQYSAKNRSTARRRRRAPTAGPDTFCLLPQELLVFFNIDTTCRALFALGLLGTTLWALHVSNPHRMQSVLVAPETNGRPWSPHHIAGALTRTESGHGFDPNLVWNTGRTLIYVRIVAGANSALSDQHKLAHRSKIAGSWPC